MQTITIDIINSKALRLLQDLELLQLIRLRKTNTFDNVILTNTNKYKGSMSKQSIDDINSQLNDIRDGWE